jgi:hypothetical protein
MVAQHRALEADPIDITLEVKASPESALVRQRGSARPGNHVRSDGPWRARQCSTGEQASTKPGTARRRGRTLTSTASGLSSAAHRLARPNPEERREREVWHSMTIKDTPPRQRGSEDRGGRAEQRPDRAHERVARAHDRSADIFEGHAVLLDRFGAHRSAKTERRHAEDERDAAETARQSATRRPGRAHGEVSRRG